MFAEIETSNMFHFCKMWVDLLVLKKIQTCNAFKFNCLTILLRYILCESDLHPFRNNGNVQIENKIAGKAVNNTPAGLHVLKIFKYMSTS